MGTSAFFYVLVSKKSLNLLPMILSYITWNPSPEIFIIPYNIDPAYLKPITTKVKGWNVDLTAIDSKTKLPAALMEYITFIEKAVNTPISIVSVGPDRKQTIRMN